MKLPEAIYCKTEEESRRIREMMHEQGLTWHGGKPYMAKSHPSIPTSEIVFYPSEGEWNHVIDHKGCRATPAAEVISRYTKQDWQPKNGDTIKAFCERWTTYDVAQFVGYTPGGKPAVADNEGYVYIVDRVEPYNNEVEQVKELMKKLGVNKYDL